MTSDDIFVWAYLPRDDFPTVAGKLSVEGGVGTFTYGKSYLSNQNAIPLDPVSLPLRGNLDRFSALNGYPSAILDACPDRWGCRVIDRIQGVKDYPLGYLMLNDPGRAGCLAFSKSATIPPVELQSREFCLSDLIDAASAVEKNQPVDDELLRALHPGTGGARPKCNVIDQNSVWIAKFPSNDDIGISIPRLEHATMELARACGIDAAETKLKVIGGRDVCFVKRFDREITEGKVARLGYLSARTVFYGDAGFDRFKVGSYPRLSRWLSQYGTNKNDSKELYRRMVFNCAVRNTDDHELNHGLIFNPEKGYVLSSAFDIVPQLKPHRIYYHALIIGENAEGTIENLLASCASFGLGADEALSLIQEITQKIQEFWQEVFYTCGFGDEELRQIEQFFRPLPARSSI